MTVHTIVGASGTIGRHLTAYLVNRGETVNQIKRNDPINWDQDLGHVYYCIGLTADFRTRLYETVTAHVYVLQEFLERGRFRSFLYTSSTRVYQAATNTDEMAELTVNPNRHDDFYNISKLMGESLCLTHQNKCVRVARISNVINTESSAENTHTFFDSLVADILSHNRLELHSSLESEKDYVDVKDVVRLMCAIATNGQERIYNVARGKNTSTASLLKLMSEVIEFDMTVIPDAPKTVFPEINVNRLENEFGFVPRPIAESVMETINSAIRRGVYETSN
jgi:nucleoside-diphosphate-sugar epimerase